MLKGQLFGGEGRGWKKKNELIDQKMVFILVSGLAHFWDVLESSSSSYCYYEKKKTQVKWYRIWKLASVSKLAGAAAHFVSGILSFGWIV